MWPCVWKRRKLGEYNLSASKAGTVNKWVQHRTGSPKSRVRQPGNRTTYMCLSWYMTGGFKIGRERVVQTTGVLETGGNQKRPPN